MEPKQLRLDFPELADAQVRPEDVQALIALARKINGNTAMQVAILQALNAMGWVPSAPTAPVSWIPPRMALPSALIVAPVMPGPVSERQ